MLLSHLFDDLEEAIYRAWELDQSERAEDRAVSWVIADAHLAEPLAA